MTSETKALSNQTNALKSTGPTSEAGKQVVAANPVKHGLASASTKHAILPAERAEFEKYLAQFLDHFKPVGPEETRLVNSISENSWRERRAHAMEAALFAQAIAEAEEGTDPILAQANALKDPKSGLQRIALYANRIRRAIEKDTVRLDALQSARKAAYAKAQEEAILFAKLARAKGLEFQPADHFPADGDFGGFAYSDQDLAQVILRQSRLEEARARFSPAPPRADFTMRDLEALIG